MAEDRIRVSFMLNYPFVNPKCSHVPHFRVGPKCSLPGLTVEILQLLTTYLNLTIETVKVIETSEGYKAFDEVHNNETDTYAFLYSEDVIDFKDRFDFTNEVFAVCRFCYTFNIVFSLILSLLRDDKIIP